MQLKKSAEYLRQSLEWAELAETHPHVAEHWAAASYYLELASFTAELEKTPSELDGEGMFPEQHEPDETGTEDDVDDEWVEHLVAEHEKAGSYDEYGSTDLLL